METPQVQGAKVRTQGAKVSISASRYRMQQDTTTTTTTTTDQIGPAQHDAVIIATCARALYKPSPYAKLLHRAGLVLSGRWW